MLRLAVLGVLLPAANAEGARVSTECSRLHPSDGVLLIDMQNCFMEQRLNKGEVWVWHGSSLGDLTPNCRTSLECYMGCWIPRK